MKIQKLIKLVRYWWWCVLLIVFVALALTVKLTPMGVDKVLAHAGYEPARKHLMSFYFKTGDFKNISYWVHKSQSDDLYKHPTMKLLQQAQGHTSDGFDMEIKHFEDIESLDESMWRYSAFTVSRYGGHYDGPHKIMHSGEPQAFETADGAVFYLEKIGGSGAGVGLYRYFAHTKKLEFFEPDGENIPYWNEILELADEDHDGYPEIVANSRKYHGGGFDNIDSKYRWLPDAQVPILIKN